MARSANQTAKPKRTDKAQSDRFKETAREIGADEDAEAFERTFAKIVPPKTAGKRQA